MPFSGMSDILYRFYHMQHLHKVLRSCLQRARSPKEQDVSGIQHPVGPASKIQQVLLNRQDTSLLVPGLHRIKRHLP